MPLVDIIGYAAGLLILVSIIPQIVKSWKTKSTKDISLARYLIYVAGVILWLVYGIILVNGPMIIVNSINLILASMVIFLRVKYGNA
ncbi:MAG: SemiSWEET transporter [Parcubacteria group bacterium]